MKRFSHSRQLAAPVDDIIALITSEAYLQRRYYDERLLDFGLEVVRDNAESFEVRVRRVVDPSGHVPGPAKPLVGESVEILQINTWQRSGPPFHGTTRASIPGVPGSIDAHLRLQAADANSTLMTVDGSVEVKIPLIGRQLSGFMVGVAQDTFVKSMDIIEECLNDN